MLVARCVWFGALLLHSIRLRGKLLEKPNTLGRLDLGSFLAASQERQFLSLRRHIPRNVLCLGKCIVGFMQPTVNENDSWQLKEWHCRVKCLSSDLGGGRLTYSDMSLILWHKTGYCVFEGEQEWSFDQVQWTLRGGGDDRVGGATNAQIIYQFQKSY